MSYEVGIYILEVVPNFLTIYYMLKFKSIIVSSEFYWTTKVLFSLYVIINKVPIILYFARLKRPSGNCYVSCFHTEKTPLYWYYNDIYRTRVIITRGLYIFNPIFEDHFLFSRRFFHKILSLCMVSIQERVMMARVQYIYQGAVHKLCCLGGGGGGRGYPKKRLTK